MLIRKDDLDAAVDHGVISAQAARDLAGFVETRNQAPRAANEPFRIANNFAEVFICIGLIMVFTATLTLLSLFGLVYIAIAVIGFWLLTEYFTFHTTKTAPAIVSAAFTCVLLVNAGFHYSGHSSQMAVWNFAAVSPTIAFFGLAACIAIVFIRFRLPILLLPLAAAATAGVLALSGSSGLRSTEFLWPLGLCGLVILATAIWLDARDPLRRSKANAYAFWLFIIGSPLTIHPIIVLAIVHSDSLGQHSMLIAAFTLALVATVLGLILDRRSLVASSLIYFTYSVTRLNNLLTDEIAVAIAMTGLIVGLSAVLLGVFWYRLRARLMQLLPFPALKAKLPPYST